MAIGIKIIEIILKDNLLSNSQKIGNSLIKNLVDIVGTNAVTDARGIGLMIGIEFDTKVRRDFIVKHLFKKDLLVLPAGKKSIRILQPLIINEEEASKGVSLINDTINEYIK